MREMINIADQASSGLATNYFTRTGSLLVNYLVNLPLTRPGLFTNDPPGGQARNYSCAIVDTLTSQKREKEINFR